VKKFAILFFLIAATFCLQAQTLSWDLIFEKGKLENLESVSFSDGYDQRMKTGEYYKVTVTPDPPCYCYIFFRDAEEGITVLKEEYIKSKTSLRAYPLTEPAGRETLYIIMSLERQTGIENMIRALTSDPISEKNLYNEILSLQNKISPLGEPVSTFITSAGTERGGNSTNINRYSNKSVYVRAISIRH
jgi:phage-related protein